MLKRFSLSRLWKKDDAKRIISKQPDSEQVERENEFEQLLSGIERCENLIALQSYPEWEFAKQEIYEVVDQLNSALIWEDDEKRKTSLQCQIRTIGLILDKIESSEDRQKTLVEKKLADFGPSQKEELVID